MITQPNTRSLGYSNGQRRSSAGVGKGTSAARRPRRPAESAPAAAAAADYPTIRALMEMVPAAMALADVCGRVIHANRAFADLLEGCGDAGTLSTEVAWLAPLIATPAAARVDRGAGDDTAGQQVRLRTGIYQLRGMALPPGRADGPGMVLITVGAPAAPSLCREDMRARWGLTKQECEVARYLTEGRSDKAIARALEISVHTARHHAERVRSKLGVSSRAEVAGQLLGAI